MIVKLREGSCPALTATVAHLQPAVAGVAAAVSPHWFMRIQQLEIINLSTVLPEFKWTDK